MKKLLFILFLVIHLPLHSQPELSEDSRIFVLTCGQGKEIFNTFGHTAIRILDGKTDLIFNYGIYDFATDNFVLKFLKGTLPYKLGVGEYDRFINIYRREKRSVYSQELNLDFGQIKEIYSFLVENYKPENREYQYDFFFDNCSTRPKDVFKDAIPKFSLPKTVKNITFREMLDENLKAHPWSDFGIDLIIGSIADRPADVDEQCFLPLYLHDHLMNSFIEEKPIVKSEDLVLDFISEREAYESTFRIKPYWFFFGIISLVLLVGLFFKETLQFKWMNVTSQIWFFVLGIGGLIIMFLWFGTDHISTKGNYNLLWMHPLYLLILIPPFYKSKVYQAFVYGLIGLNTIVLLADLLGVIPQAFPQPSFLIILATNIFLLIQVYMKKKRDDQHLDFNTSV